MKCSIEELLIETISRLLDGLGHVAVGAASPIPGSAALLARERSGGTMRVSILGSARHNTFTDGGRELFDCAAQGRIDAFFLGGAQIDGHANVNLLGTGGYPRSRMRFAGCFGSSYLYALVPSVILFTLEHSPRVLVPKVDFVSAAGTSPAHVYRRGGPTALVTSRCVFRFDRAGSRFELASVHPGQDAVQVAAHTGFAFHTPDRMPETAEPDIETLTLIRGPVRGAIAEVYPRFAERMFRCTDQHREAEHGHGQPLPPNQH